ncbi:rhodanese-like domain-containing protein [Paracidovorax wautersii]|uniref:Rhodanese-related sulfurtransferase/predicted metal-dependent enzyme (Double-stranded beta helix superfamily) n=1 Tax=Paracidovorax wautersii TaxID=1177982 RepID=A0ABU1I975_9BURK|nr:rhodanese-like domain-containing protein [Paracidovorax wautersii]MDR6213775.1 rhodanese-related sulfurtransferase/predicted metal-dependent enzyme (double-stranded beta helix superfamily) [Paracidovorax wautersii]
MTQTHLSLDFSGSDIASRRTAAVTGFLATARRLVPDPEHSTPEQLRAVAAALEQLGLQRALFPNAHFAVSADNPAQVYRLSEDPGGRYALYVSAGSPGKAQPPHDHTTWAMIAGVAGNERNVFYRRDTTADAARDALTAERTVDVVAGVSVVLSPTDVHTIELVGDEPGLHLHFYGRGLDRMPERVVFESKAGGTYRTFAPPKSIRHPLVTPQDLKAALHDGEEIAVLDVRETGVFAHRHILFAASAPLWRLELLIDRLVPRRSTRIVLVDGDETLSHEAAAKLVRLGWRNVSVLAGGTDGWAAAGLEVFEGTNVPSKAFGEVIEHEKHTPWITSDELQARVERGDNIVVVDSRTPEEFAAFSLPFAHSLPGAELVYRIGELAPDPETFVVVNCAGRTRSIVGAQTLIDAGIPNRVASLRNGTMDWLLTGRTLSHGRGTALPEPAPATLAAARARAAAVAERAGVQRIDAAELARFESEAQERTLYRFDVRTREEYEAGHLEGWRWAPGGQLVQATDEYAAARGARIVLADWDGVRALTTGAWLAQLGGYEVFLYAPPALPALATGPEPVRVLASHAPAPLVSPQQADALVRAGSAVVFDVDRRAAFEKQHIHGARFAVPDRLATFVADLPAGHSIVLTSPDGVLARTAAAELAARTGRDVRALSGGTSAWVAAGLPVAQGDAGVLTGDDDHWYSPYAHRDLQLRDAGFHDYLDWELGLVAQLEREGTTGIRLLPAAAAAAGAAA